MKVKRFFAPDMSNAMRLVRDEVGPDAVILSNSRVAGGVEVVVALEYDPPKAAKPRDLEQRARRERSAAQPEARSRAAQLQSELGRTRSALAKSQARAESGEVPPLLKAVRDKQLGLDDDVWEGVLNSLQSRERTRQEPPRKRPVNVVSKQPARIRPTVAASQRAPAVRQAPLSQPQAAAPSMESGELRAMRDELESLKSILRNRLEEPRPVERPQADEVRDKVRERFARMGLAEGLARRLVEAIEPGTDPEHGWKIALARLIEALPAVGEDIVDRGGVLAFVGPTGVGKTTTIGKLAARYVLKHGSSSVALVTTDAYRIAAHEQLRTFGRILDIPVRVVDENRSLDEALHSLRDRRLVLVDTSGMGGQAGHGREQLKMLRESAYRIKKFLVLPCTAQYQVLKGAYEFFKPLGLNGAVLSKVDESFSLGEVISTVVEQRLPVAYLADGQRIPDNIELARPNALVSRAVVMAESHDIPETVDADQQPALYAHSGDVV